MPWRELAFHTGVSSFKLDFIYWATMNPHENGPLLFATSTDNNGTVRDSSFSTSINPDLEMGVRAMYTWPKSELWSFEFGGHWLHNFDYPFRIQSGAISTGPNSTVTNTLTFIPNNREDLQLASVNYEYRNFGLESNARGLLVQSGRFALDGIVGLRYVSHTERFDSRIEVGGLANPIEESFKTSNNYFGPQLGVEARYAIFDYVSLKASAKTVFSANLQAIKIDGPGDGNGRFTAVTNQGSNDQADYAQLWDLGIGAVFHLTPNIHLHSTYDSIFLDNLVRSMDQIDQAGIATQTPQPLRNRSRTWMGGWSLGLEISY